MTIKITAKLHLLFETAKYFFPDYFPLLGEASRFAALAAKLLLCMVQAWTLYFNCVVARTLRRAGEFFPL